MRMSKPIMHLLGGMLLLSACTQTQTGDHTTMGAAAGGLVGAGLGAVVGNQVGNTGEGLALGAVAGAGTGALIGSALDRQETAIRNQDEAMERQERVIMAQQNELTELRQMGQDSVSFKGSERPLAEDRQMPASATRQFSFPSRPPVRHQEFRNQEVHSSLGATSSLADNGSRAAVQPRMPSAVRQVSHAGVQERDITTPSDQASERAAMPVARGSYGWSQRQQESTSSAAAPASDAHQNRRPVRQEEVPTRMDPPAPEPVRQASVPQAVTEAPLAAVAGASTGVAGQIPAPAEATTTARLGTPECEKAKTEARSASTAREAADKLFHYRRALRLCPDNADFHNGLGEVYVTLNRNEDARYEFQEALKLQPGHSGARSNLTSIQ